MIGARRDTLQCSGRPAAVVVGAVLGEDGPQVPFAEDQDAVVEFGSGCADERSAKQFALGQRGGILTVSILW